MLELGKRDNGVTIFDKQNLVKVDIIGRRGLDFLIYFDTLAHEQFEGPEYGWFVYSMNIPRKENSELCNPLDEFHKKAFDLVYNNREEYEKYTKFGNNAAILRQNGGPENYQIQYPSDDDNYFSATFLGVTKCKELGHILSFDKSVNDMKKLSFLLKFYGTHYPKLATLFENLFEDIRDVATRPYKECNEEYEEEVKKRLTKK